MLGIILWQVFSLVPLENEYTFQVSEIHERDKAPVLRLYDIKKSFESTESY